MTVELVPKEGIAAQKRIAMLSDSAIMRVSMNAFNLLIRQSAEMKAFRPIDHDKAFDWLSERSNLDKRAALLALRDLLKIAGFESSVLHADWKNDS